MVKNSIDDKTIHKIYIFWKGSIQNLLEPLNTHRGTCPTVSSKTILTQKL